MRVKSTVLRIPSEKPVVTKQIKLNKMEKRHSKKEKKIMKKIVTIIKSYNNKCRIWDSNLQCRA